MDLLALGELLIDFVSSEPDVSLIHAPGFVKAPGGAPANVAVAAARMGLSSGFIGKVGEDPFGQFLRETLVDTGVSDAHLYSDPEARTTLAFIATRTDGRKDIAFYRNPGADAQLSPEELPFDALRSCRCLHFGSVSMSREPARSATLRAVEAAREAGALISFDPNWRPPLWEDYTVARDLIWHAMPLADVVKLADEEWEFVTGTQDLEEGARKVLDAGPKLCLVTLGAEGAYYHNGTVQGRVPGFTVPVADTLGAGDAFVGAVLSEFLIAGKVESLSEGDLQRIVRFGNAAGALTCTGTGVIPSLPHRAAVQRFLSEQESSV
ncbi:MAG: carbohydrate kinase [Armatimonadetes bacterium]|nr:carbohydrate kinase [Armatimonadota bacterium]